MTFTPIFIPMSGGGGGGPIWPVIVINAVLIGGVIKLWDYSFNPTFHLELRPSRYNATLCLKKRNCPKIQTVRYLNTECLEQKGYSFFGTWNEYGSIMISKEGDFNVKQLIADCKECNTYVEVDYDYTTVFSGKTKDATKRLSWASCNVRRELQ
jgi:hypothetical protein